MFKRRHIVKKEEGFECARCGKSLPPNSEAVILISRPVFIFAIYCTEHFSQEELEQMEEIKSGEMPGI